MTIIALGIESSCDDTSASIVTSEREILSNIVYSQVKDHLPFSGVVPEIASRAHMNLMDYAINDALSKASISLSQIDIIAATGGPGLIGGVIVGTMYAKALSSVLKKPYIAVNHLEGHALTARLTENVQYPYLLVLLSGGHCQILAVLSLGKYVLLGQTRDDAVGEAFDKVAKMLNLGYPGGPIIEEKAKYGDQRKFSLPKSMCDREGCEMSFSGLKTAVRNIINTQLSEANSNSCDNFKNQFICDISASFQYTILEILKYKISEAMKQYEKLAESRQIVIAGGVAANKYLISNIKDFAHSKGYELYAPPLNLCTDNAAMIAWAGIERYQAGFKNNLDFCPKARWPLY